MAKLSVTQEKAMEVITEHWETADHFRVLHNISINTLKALCKKGYIQEILNKIRIPNAEYTYRLKPQYPEGVIESDMRLQINEPGKCKDFSIRFGTIQAETIDRFGNERTEITVKGDGIKVTICIDTEKLIDALEAGGMEAAIGEKTREVMVSVREG